MRYFYRLRLNILTNECRKKGKIDYFCWKRWSSDDFKWLYKKSICSTYRSPFGVRWGASITNWMEYGAQCACGFLLNFRLSTFRLLFRMTYLRMTTIHNKCTTNETIACTHTLKWLIGNFFRVSLSCSLYRIWYWSNDSWKIHFSLDLPSFSSPLDILIIYQSLFWFYLVSLIKRQKTGEEWGKKNIQMKN